MKLSIDFTKQEITILEDWNLGELHSKLKEICGSEEGNWDKWTIKQEVKTVMFPQKESIFNDFSLSQPYKPFGNQPTMTYTNQTI